MHGHWHGQRRASGAMDNASDYGSEDSRFDSWLARKPFLPLFNHAFFLSTMLFRVTAKFPWSD